MSLKPIDQLVSVHLIEYQPTELSWRLTFPSISYELKSYLEWQCKHDCDANDSANNCK